MKRPIAKNVLGDRNIHYSRSMPACTGLPGFCDIGEARVGNDKHKGEVIPGIYRAPEVVLGMDWGYSVDNWSICTMVSSTTRRLHLVGCHVCSQPTKLMNRVGLGFGGRRSPFSCKKKSHPQ